jgi:hypothetical protein
MPQREVPKKPQWLESLRLLGFLRFSNNEMMGGNH